MALPPSDAMHATVREYLIDIANTSKTVTYSELNIRCQLGLDLALAHDRAELGYILGDIISDEYDHGRPLLSVVAVLADTRLPSTGFYNLAESLGLGTVKRLQADLFGEMEMARCFDFWRKPTNYRRHR
jgi:hypothetical protein